MQSGVRMIALIVIALLALAFTPGAQPCKEVSCQTHFMPKENIGREK